MVKFYPSLPSHLRDWALNQPLFFTASAPLTGRHINISPKGLPSRTLAFFDANHLAYIDHSGSGAETMSHVYENGRLTLMFCSFDTAPQILRLFCTGRVIEFDHPDFPSCVDKMGKTVFEGARAVILLEVFKVISLHPTSTFNVPSDARRRRAQPSLLIIHADLHRMRFRRPPIRQTARPAPAHTRRDAAPRSAHPRLLDGQNRQEGQVDGLLRRV